MNTISANRPDKTWMLIGGLLSIIVGVFAISAPSLFSYLITSFIGALCLVSGVIGLLQALLGKEVPHRILSGFSSLIRFAAGSVLFVFTVSGIETLTLILGAVFFAEGIFCIVTSLKIRSYSGWLWLFFNGIIAVVLAGMIYSRWPSDSDWVIGVLYGIQSLFSGTAMLALGFSASKKS